VFSEEESRTVRTVLYRRAKTNSVKFINAGSLVGTTAVTSMLGLAYWWVAARGFPPQTVGLGSAAISAMTLLGTVCIVGLGTLLVGELPRQLGKEGSLISAALIIVGGIGGCAGMVFAAVAPFVAVDFQTLRASIVDIVLFASGVSLTAITLVLDQAMIGLLRGELQFWRNTLFAVAKLAALFAASLWLSHSVGLTIYTTWAVGNALSLAALVGVAVLKRGGFSRRDWPEWGLLRKLGPAALQHHLLNLTLQAPMLALPVLVTVVLSATTNAWFYVSWQVAGFMFVVPTIILTVLYATISGNPTALAQKTRLTLSLAFVASMVAAVVALLAARQVLGLFGQAYAEQSASSLRILPLGSFPIIIKHHYVAICRMQGRMACATLSMIVGGLFELGVAALGARFGGLPGLSLGWVAAAYIEAAFMSRTVYKAVRLIDVPTRRTFPIHADLRGWILWP
jgi:O-antigen/teichoic acid export membrane protein